MEDILSFLQNTVFVAVSIYLRFLILAGAIYLIFQIFTNAKKRTVFKVPTFKGQISFEIITGIFIALFDAAILVIATAFDLIPNGTPTWSNHIITFLGLAVWFEFSLYFIHRLLHTKPFYRIHRHHHQSKVTTPFSSISSSLIDRALGIFVPMTPVVLLSFLGLEASQAGLIAYFTLLFVINIYTHINVEVVPTAVVKNRVLGAMLITPSFHSLHHARFQGNYGITTPIMDVIFGTRFKDYEQVHEKSRNGEGMVRLGQRIKIKDQNKDAHKQEKLVNPVDPIAVSA